MPETAEQKTMVQNSFAQLLDVVATEDFPMLPRMQKNFEQNPHAELVFGRNEPCLRNMHTHFKAAVSGRY